MGAPQLLRDAGLDAVIGMYPVVHRLRSTVIAPWAAAATGDPAVRAPKRVLLHGLSGSGASFIAHRLADELSIHTAVGAVVLPALDDEMTPDEVAVVLAAPETSDVVLIGVTHRPWELPMSLFEDGGFERLAFVPPPDWDARRFRIWESPWGSRLEPGDLDTVVAATEGWAGSDLALLGGVGSGSVPTLEELMAAIAPGATDAGEWLAQARDMVRHFDAYGRIDDLVSYLQRYRLL